MTEQQDHRTQDRQPETETGLGRGSSTAQSSSLNRHVLRAELLPGAGTPFPSCSRGCCALRRPACPSCPPVALCPVAQGSFSNENLISALPTWDPSCPSPDCEDMSRPPLPTAPWPFPHVAAVSSLCSFSSPCAACWLMLCLGRLPALWPGFLPHPLRAPGCPGLPCPPWRLRPAPPAAARRSRWARAMTGRVRWVCVALSLPGAPPPALPALQPSLTAALPLAEWYPEVVGLHEDP